MLKKFGLHALALGLGLAVVAPTVATARDHDRDDYYQRDYRHQRHEERERARHFLRNDYWYGPNATGPNYAMGPGGYYDQWGYWHPYHHGHYDRWGNWHQ